MLHYAGSAANVRAFPPAAKVKSWGESPRSRESNSEYLRVSDVFKQAFNTRGNIERTYVVRFMVNMIAPVHLFCQRITPGGQGARCQKTPNL